MNVKLLKLWEHFSDARNFLYYEDEIQLNLLDNSKLGKLLNMGVVSSTRRLFKHPASDNKIRAMAFSQGNELSLGQATSS